MVELYGEEKPSCIIELLDTDIGLSCACWVALDQHDKDLVEKKMQILKEIKKVDREAEKAKKALYEKKKELRCELEEYRKTGVKK